jgi:hypothetical protein
VFIHLLLLDGDPMLGDKVIRRRGVGRSLQVQLLFPFPFEKLTANELFGKAGP